MTDKYEQIIEGIPFNLKTGKKALEIACCDCGLVHVVDIEVIDMKNIRLTFRKDERATEVRRIYKQGDLLDETNEEYLMLGVI